MKKLFYNLLAAKIILFALLFAINGCKKEKKEKELFSAVFMTDIHLEPERNAVAGFTHALDVAESMNPDFIITGGDLVMDALGQRFGRADTLYSLYQETVKHATVPVYNSMGNHEVFGIYKKSGVSADNPEYGEKMFENRIGPSYYSFDYKGWKFIIINSVEDTGKGRYIGMVDSLQMEWLKDELVKTDSLTPIVISTHIPFITASFQRYGGSTMPADSSRVVCNSKNVLDMFKGYNLKLVLQGHLHINEEIMIDGVHFITCGAVSGAWWTGPRVGNEEGFGYITFTKNDFSFRYIDYGWEVSK